MRILITLCFSLAGFRYTAHAFQQHHVATSVLRPRRNDWFTGRRTIACHVASLRDETEIVSLPTPASTTTSQSSPQSNLGLGILFTVPIMWGTYNPVVKYLYGLETPVPGLVFSAGYFWVGATTLWILQAIFSDRKNDEVSSPGATSINGSDGPSNPGLQWQCGFELGTYLFMGALLQVWGLRTVPADRASFLIQLTTVIVPFLEYFVGGKALSRTTVFASILAFLGVVLIELEGSSEGPFSDSMLSGDPTDGLLLLASLFYSLHVVRLGHYAPRLQPLQLAKSKATAQGVLSTAFIASLLWLFPSDNPMSTELVDFFSSVSTTGLPAIAAAAIVFAGWTTGSGAIFAQSLGQRLVASPTTANMLYSLQPLFTAIFAYLLLGEEISGIMGGSCILAAVFLVGSQKDESDEATQPAKEILPTLLMEKQTKSTTTVSRKSTVTSSS